MAFLGPALDVSRNPFMACDLVLALVLSSVSKAPDFQFFEIQVSYGSGHSGEPLCHLTDSPAALGHLPHLPCLSCPASPRSFEVGLECGVPCGV